MSETRLFQTPDSFARQVLNGLPQALDRIMPQQRAQAQDLPQACRDLSSLLTQERAELRRPYWISARLTAAYLRYFLPWNLIRLSALLPGLSLDKLCQQPLIVDLGSGPLTLGLALWMSRPDLRALPLTLIAADNSPRPLDLGKKLFNELTREYQPDCAWKIRTLRSPLQHALTEIPGQPGLICLGNVLNEWEGQTRQGGQAHRLDGLMQIFARRLHPDGQLLAIEPGTRLGGKLIAMLRQAAKPFFSPLAPCPHHLACPMLSGKHTAWCHFRHKPRLIPDYLDNISHQAGLSKQTVSLSFVQLGRTDAMSKRTARTEPVTARVISNPFSLPDRDGPVCYLCTSLGLGLLVDEKIKVSGSAFPIRRLTAKDAKSGALLMRLA